MLRVTSHSERSEESAFGARSRPRCDFKRDAYVSVTKEAGINDHMLDALALPGVGDVQLTVARLNDGGVGVLSGAVFENEARIPGFAVVR